MAKHLRCIPLTLKDANKFVNQYHRHNKDCRGHRFSIGAIYKDDEIIIPKGDTIIDINDIIIVFAEKKSVKKLETILSIRMDLI